MGKDGTLYLCFHSLSVVQLDVCESSGFICCAKKGRQKEKSPQFYHLSASYRWVSFKDKIVHTYSFFCLVSCWHRTGAAKNWDNYYNAFSPFNIHINNGVFLAHTTSYFSSYKVGFKELTFIYIYIPSVLFIYILTPTVGFLDREDTSSHLQLQFSDVWD